MIQRLVGLALIAFLPAAFAAPVVTLFTNKGEIDITLDDKRAPKSAANFEAYVKAGHYNGTAFHRVIDGFMVQGGGFVVEPGLMGAKLVQKATRAPIPNEANNGVKNTVGTVAMARTGDPNSATSQFFINVADNDFLNHRAPSGQGWGYAVFGRVTRGMDVVNRIAKTRTGPMGGMDDVPLEPIVIQKATLKP
ncbi:peptidylprolyl isomerase [Crenobacter cavernae]|uniref:Peptidyl-prolyl cis-trans isomerase n=1 Tax=Crenobacter cavernae TaxID=2290923 RepID=A0ABY0FDD1_9NEIS|nr:peptidylprolyl isomerase [Crenobacter cavernae]RXZ42483.1 peptidyl-prolyl cis-trans isomerase [Crenobacter cavernae]